MGSEGKGGRGRGGLESVMGVGSGAQLFTWTPTSGRLGWCWMWAPLRIIYL